MKYVVLALSLFACTLVPFLMVLANSGWRNAVDAWKQFAAWMGVLLLMGGCTWLGWFIFPPIP